MRRRETGRGLIRFLVAACVICFGFSSKGLSAEEKKLQRLTGEATLTGTLKGQKYPITLRHAVAYECWGEKETATKVLFAKERINEEQLLKSLSRDGSDSSFQHKGTSLLFSFDKKGKVLNCQIEENSDNGGSSSVVLDPPLTKGLRGELLSKSGNVEGSFQFDARGEEWLKRSPELHFEGKFSGTLNQAPVEAGDNLQQMEKLLTPEGKVSGMIKGELREAEYESTVVNLNHVAIYESISPATHEVIINVLMMDEPIEMKKILDSLARNGSDRGADYSGHYIHLKFRLDGSLAEFVASSGGVGWAKSVERIKSNLEIKNGRAKGRASYDDTVPDPKLPEEIQKLVRESQKAKIQFDVEFEGAVLITPEIKERKKRTTAGQGSVTGKMKMDHEFALTHGVAFQGEDPSDKPCTCVLLSSKLIRFDRSEVRTSSRRDLSHKFDCKDSELKLFIDKNGKVYQVSMYVPPGSNYGHGGELPGKVEVANGRAKGTVILLERGTLSNHNFYATFDVELVNESVKSLNVKKTAKMK